MLVLSRRVNESLIVDGRCRITVLRQGCKLGIEGSARVFREELLRDRPPAKQLEPTVYLVDDDVDLLEAYQHYLRHFGLKVKAFSRGAEFLVHVEGATDPTVAVIDLRLAHEDIDGLQILQQLRAWKHDYPVILLTGYGDVDTCRRAFLGGCYTFLQKPLPPNDLIATVREAAERYEGERSHSLSALAG